MDRHVYLIKDNTGRTVMRVTHWAYYTARKLANGWVDTLDRTQPAAAPHSKVKMRNG